jgi:hypothetical protein
MSIPPGPDPPGSLANWGGFCWKCGRRDLQYRRLSDPVSVQGNFSSLEVSHMETTKQVSVFLENKPGRLAQVLLALAREKVNVIALTIMDSHEHSVLRLVTNDVRKTAQVMDGLNAQHTESEVLIVDLRNQPGALARVCEQLALEHINIDYAYCSSGGRNGKVVGIFKVSNVEKALRLLRSPSANNNRRTEARLPRKQLNATQKLTR